MENRIWIQIQFNNYNQYDGCEELIEELKEICPVQERKKWYPSAGTGLELLLALNFNLSLSAFLNNVFIPGLEFAGVVKAANLIWKSFDKFLKKNEEFEIHQLELTFDDVVIKVEGCPTYGMLLNLYQQLPHHLEVLKGNGLEDICEIKLPYIMNTDGEADKKTFEVAYWDDNENEHLWRIRYNLGCETVFYKPAAESLFAMDGCLVR